jgi:hypothetical protein
MIKPLAAFALVLAIAASAANAAPAPAPAAAPTIAPGGTTTPGALTTPAGASTPVPIGTPVVPPTSTPSATPSSQLTAAPSGTASPAFDKGAAPPGATPPSNLVTFTGQLLDYRKNYVYFTTGDAFPTVDDPRIVDAFTGLPTTVTPQAKMFAKVTFDPATKKIIELAITKRRMQTSQSLGPATAFVVVGSSPIPAPEIAGQNLTGKQVSVEFEVTVPPTTSFTDQVYISTDSSDWNPTAIKLDRVDGYKYRALRYFASGTKFAYRVTRGSWNSVERGEDNLDGPPHQFFVREVDALAARVTVYHWSDEHANSEGAGPAAIPTPYNPRPFGGGPGGITVPQIPTPQPTPIR